MKRFLFCPVLLIICGCSVLDSTPTIDRAKAEIEAVLAQESKPNNSICVVRNGVRVADIHKVDGQSRESHGAKAYCLSYEGEFEFTQDGRVPPNASIDVLYCSAPPPGSGYDQNAFMRKVRKGQREKFAGELMFQKTENGWRVATNDCGTIIHTPGW
jgi:hypothetical protein